MVLGVVAPPDGDGDAVSEEEGCSLRAVQHSGQRGAAGPVVAGDQSTEKWLRDSPVHGLEVGAVGMAAAALPQRGWEAVNWYLAAALHWKVVG